VADRTDIRKQISEADLLEQQTPLRPPLTADALPASPVADTRGDADEADRIEQHAAVLVDDEDDYPHEVLSSGWS
jgi:hypothetical protein